MRLDPGAVFAGYTIERVLGHGGMGIVYAARHPRLERLVALKVLSDAIAGDARGRARFEREAALAARLEHPNIVPIYDRADSDAEVPWICMKYVGGGDISLLMAARRAPLPAAEAVRLIGDAARGLDYAHRYGIVHRDIKPANILIDRTEHDDGRAILTDFGIARAFDDTLTTTGIAATFAYAAPERFGLNPADHRADIYSLGCTLYEILTGSTPFPRADQAAVIAAHLSTPPPHATDLQPGLPPGLDEVIATAMAKNPEDRYPTCQALAEAAHQVLAAAQQPTVIHRPAFPAPPPAPTVVSPATGSGDTAVPASPIPEWIHHIPAVAEAAREALGVAAPVPAQPPEALSEGNTLSDNGSGGTRTNIARFGALLSGLLFIVGGVLTLSGLKAGFVLDPRDSPSGKVYDLERIDFALYKGGFYFSCLGVTAILLGGLSLLPRLRRKFGPALLAGFTPAALWGAVVLGRLAVWLGRANDPIRVGPGFRLIFAGHLTIVLAGLFAVLTLIVAQREHIEFRSPRGRFAIASTILGLLGFATVLLVRMSTEYQSYLQDDYLWMTITAALLAAIPIATSALLPRRIFTALTLGWAAGGLSMSVFFATQTIRLINRELPSGTVGFGFAVPGALAVTLIALAIVNIIEFRRADTVAPIR